MTFEELFTPEELAQLRTRTEESQEMLILGLEIALLILTTISTVLRLYTRKHRGNPLKADDYTAIAASLGFLGIFLSSRIGLRGLGRHVITLTWEEYQYFETTVKIKVTFYILDLTFVKIAVLLLFMRIFTIPRFIRAGCTLIGLSLAWGILYLVFLFTECSRNTKKDGCVNLKGVLYSMNTLNIITDILIFLFPIPYLLNLKISRARKVALFFILLLGLSVVGISIARLFFIAIYLRKDFTWHAVPIYLACIFEASIGILCANFPVIYPLIGEFYKPSRSQGHTSREDIQIDRFDAEEKQVKCGHSPQEARFGNRQILNFTSSSGSQDSSRGVDTSRFTSLR